MAIIKRSNGSYQVKLRGTDGKWVTRTFLTKHEATAYEIDFKRRRIDGFTVTSSGNHMTMDDYFAEWFRMTAHQGTGSWRKQQEAIYRKHVRPHLGRVKVKAVTPQMIAVVLNASAEKGYAAASTLHLYVVMRKMFGDAIELFQLLHVNPVLKKLRPRLSQKEVRYLNLEQLKRLLNHVRGKPLGLAVWLSAYLGLRVGEVQALRWEDVDLETGVVHIRRAYSKHDGVVFRDYPKGRKQHSHRVPQELLDFLEEMKGSATGELVVIPVGWKMLDYWNYRRVLKDFCQKAEIPVMATHGLRHSTSGVYRQFGATREDLRQLYGHIDASTTERYTHGDGENLQRVAKVIRLFGKCSPDVPQEERKEG